MRKRKSLLTLFFTVSIVILVNNSSAHSQKNEIDTVVAPSGVKLAYNSSIIYPGLRTGLELPFLEKTIHKKKRNGVLKTRSKKQFLTFNFGWYHQPSFHDNFYLTTGYTFRKTRQKGFMTEWGVEIGYSRTIINSTTYSVSESGEISTRTSGYNHFICSIGAGMGYDLRKKKSLPLLLNTKMNLLLMTPYNNTVYLRPAVEIGITYFHSQFLSRMIKSKTIHKI
ncbi:MAG: hypothetical protein WED10_12745 [Brumimicrobium sp.]